MSQRTSRRVGRPRAQDRPASGLEPRDEVLAAAAELFTTHGYTATSTRAVAERAGLRQASLYHYFDGKEAILAALLEGTVRPSLEVARTLVARTGAGPEARLWALCHSDVLLLCSGPHNLGALYLLPEVQAESFADFHRIRAELKACYGELIAEIGPDASPPVDGTADGDALALVTDLVFGLTESVILIRRSDPDRDPRTLAAATADAALRVAGVPRRSQARLRREAEELLAARA
ncbi:helix-turn-helix domain-containing protein [Streptomyces sp. NPDC048002]|uniref:TetR/AcrR family transcriptional regulator n=1 Tax=Streptomyces sp. NPDC048002 TaxID=3154344 RepID=UPI0033C60BAE